MFVPEEEYAEEAESSNNWRGSPSKEVIDLQVLEDSLLPPKPIKVRVPYGHYPRVQIVRRK
jgi:hypothetical protein